MGKDSDAMMEYLKDNERFADLFNGSFFQGNQMIKPEELQEGSEVYKEDKRLNTSAERMCGLTASDRLEPVFTVCLYHGEDKWQGPKNLRDMMDFGEDEELWQQLFSDYQMRLICLNEMEDFSQFHSSLRQLLAEDASYQEMDKETADVVSALMGVEKEMVRKNDGEEKYNMCTAIREMLEDSRQEGCQEGQREIIKNLLNNGLTCEKIAELTSMGLEAVQCILQESGE